MTSGNAHALEFLSVRIWWSAAFFAAAVTLLSPATAQYAASGSEARKQQHAPGGGAPRRKKNSPGGKTSPQYWGGLSLDLGVSRPINSHVLISTSDIPVGEFNLTGIHVAVTAAYLFQEGRFVIGPRVKASGGWIESMPHDYTIRTSAVLIFGGEAGMALGRWYGYGFGGGGAALLSAERVGVGRANNMVPAYELGAGVRYALAQRWYAKTEISYTTLGDHRLGADYFDPKPYLSFTAGFGFQFASK